MNALAAAFLEAGVGKGDIVALLMGNRPEFLESALAVNRVGAAFLPLNVRLAEPELEYIIRHAGAVAIVTEPGFAAPVAAIGGRLTDPVDGGDGRRGRGGRGRGAVRYESFLGAHRGASVPPADVGEADLHRLMYSSGTTAHPKGVPITLRELLLEDDRARRRVRHQRGGPHGDGRADVPRRGVRPAGHRHLVGRRQPGDPAALRRA